MADLDKRDDREDWLKWAIEFMRRGLWAGDTIVVHGPHSPVDYMWGEAEARVDGGRSRIDGGPYWSQFEFRTASGIRGIHDVRGVRVKDAADGTPFPVLKLSELTPKAQRWLRMARRTKAKLQEERTALCSYAAPSSTSSPRAISGGRPG